MSNRIDDQTPQDSQVLQDSMVIDYLYGALSADAHAAFEARLAADPDLRHTVDAYRAVLQQVKQLPQFEPGAATLAQIRHVAAAVHRDETTRPTTWGWQRIFRWPSYPAANAAVAMLGAAVLIWGGIHYLARPQRQPAVATRPEAPKSELTRSTPTPAAQTPMAQPEKRKRANDPDEKTIAAAKRDESQNRWTLHGRQMASVSRQDRPRPTTRLLVRRRKAAAPDRFDEAELSDEATKSAAAPAAAAPLTGDTLQPRRAAAEVAAGMAEGSAERAERNADSLLQSAARAIAAGQCTAPTFARLEQVLRNNSQLRTRVRAMIVPCKQQLMQQPIVDYRHLHKLFSAQ